VNLNGTRTFTGFGLGAIQAGLFLYEAIASGNFYRLVVAEVLPEVVYRVRKNDGFLAVNIAYADHVEAVPVGPIEILNPSVEGDRQMLVEALSCSHEICTAVPATRYYSSAGPESLCHILAAGLQAKVKHDGPPAVLYAAENHNHAAEILEELVLLEIPPADRETLLGRVRFLNTVIGKMSGVVAGRSEIESLNLIPMTPESDRAFLVEAFNRILISRISFPKNPFAPVFERGITTFIEKNDLLPFEEAKLFGHNATHAMAAYIGEMLGVCRIADIPSIPGLYGFLRRAFIEESGKALIHRYNGLDPLFTPQGFADYADDLLSRMVNPWLTDTAERVGRDVERKLSWDDRLVGTLRLGLSEGVTPRCYALGTAAALVRFDPGLLTQITDPADRLLALWGDSPREPAQESVVLELIRDALDHLRRWHAKSPRDPQALLTGL
jgi:mannitol-1-phosphate/altronate dehydrogenase